MDRMARLYIPRAKQRTLHKIRVRVLAIYMDKNVKLIIRKELVKFQHIWMRESTMEPELKMMAKLLALVASRMAVLSTVVKKRGHGRDLESLRAVI